MEFWLKSPLGVQEAQNTGNLILRRIHLTVVTVEEQ